MLVEIIHEPHRFAAEPAQYLGDLVTRGRSTARTRIWRGHALPSVLSEYSAHHWVANVGGHTLIMRCSGCAVGTSGLPGTTTGNTSGPLRWHSPCRGWPLGGLAASLRTHASQVPQQSAGLLGIIFTLPCLA